MLKILMVSQNLNNAAELEKGIEDSGYQICAKITTESDLYAALVKYSPNAIVIDVEHPKKDVLDQMRIINESKPTPIIMFSQKANNDAIEAVVNAGVSAYVVDGLSSARVKSIIETALVRFRQLMSIRNELQKTKSVLAERKMIDKAKGLIMRHRDCDEDQAYQALRKMAMDGNKRIGQMANDVINIFAGLG